jgi:DNA-directed RNA polymerase subunit M/transcription elongation factor TFIIS
MRSNCLRLLREAHHNHEQIEKSVYQKSFDKSAKKSDDEFNEFLYSVYAVKVLLNLSDDDCVNVVNLSKEELDPAKYQSDVLLSHRERVRGLYKCPRCKSWHTNYIQMQTRSADEGMTVKCECFDCNYVWKL